MRVRTQSRHVLTIEDFTKCNRVPVRVLRHYDAIELLRPADDPPSSYSDVDQQPQLDELLIPAVWSRSAPASWRQMSTTPLTQPLEPGRSLPPRRPAARLRRLHDPSLVDSFARRIDHKINYGESPR